MNRDKQFGEGITLKNSLASGMNGLSPFPPGDEPECPECGAPLVKKEGAASRTLMAGESGYGEDGEWHNHDPNWNRSTYRCENGHKVSRQTRSECPAASCDYGGEVRMSVLDG